MSISLVSATILVCILGGSAITVTAQFCDSAGAQTTPRWIVECININSSTLYELEKVFLYIKVTNPGKDLLVEIFDSVGTDFTPEVFDGARMITLTMNNCNFTELPYYLLASLPRDMIGLNFEDNYITTIDVQAFNQMPFVQRLQYLNLQNNRLVTLAPGSFASYVVLESMYLQSNLLETLVNGTFQGLSNLRNLHLYQNSLGSVESGTFVGLTSLRMVALDLNQITFLNNGTFSIDDQPSLTQLPLEGNPFHCNCTLQWLKDYLISIDYLEPSGATCAYPEQLPFALVDFCNDTTTSSL